MIWWLCCALALAGKPKPAKSGEVPSGVPIGSARYLNAYLWSGEVDADELIGRWVASPGPTLDDQGTEASACSQYFSSEPRPAVTFEGVFNASAAAAARFGGPEGAVYVGFEASPRQVAVINDPHALSRCCADGGCAEQFVGEVVFGKGRVYWRQGESWLRGGKVKGPVGFRLSGNPYGGEDCGVWRESPPQTNKGAFFLGVSNTLYQESNAKEAALHDARSRARSWLREHKLGDAVLQQAQEERWCVESFPDEQMNTQWLAYVLLYVPG